MLKKTSVLSICIGLAISFSACGGNNTATPAPATPAPAPATPAPGGATGGTTGGTTGGANQPSGTPGTGASAGVDAQAIYKQNCVACHGVDLGGGAGPNLQKVGARRSADSIASLITNGGNGMPAFKGKLKTEEITALSTWLAANK